MRSRSIYRIEFQPKIRFTALLLLCLMTQTVMAYDITQTLLGQVTDKNTRQPLPGALIVVTSTEPKLSAMSDAQGYYKIDNVPIGRIDVSISFFGYVPLNFPNLLITSGKQVTLNAEMEEKSFDLQEVKVTAKNEDPMRANNEIAIVSARSFTVEETQKFAGSRNDVARMAANFAGVSASNDKVNDIVIRGNSPLGLLWRLEGIDIPNPNHFGDFGSTGGPVSMLNNNVLANSDFFTGAFPADYGNAYSGVFDLRMRNGNYNRHEFMAQLGFNGIEAGMEGPFAKKKSKASYLVNYRYSLLSVLSKLGFKYGVLSGTGVAVPNYQDLSFKINIPTIKAGVFSFFGVGGTSDIQFKEDGKGNGNLYSANYQDLTNRVKTGIAGFTHTYNIDSKTFMKLTLAYAGTAFRVKIDSVSADRSVITPEYANRFVNQKGALNYFVSHKINAKHFIKSGFSLDMMFYNFKDSTKTNEGNFFHTLDKKGYTFLVQPYINWQYKPTRNLTLNVGLHYVHLFLNNSWSLEPRVALSYRLHERHVLSIGYGMHGQMAPLQYYMSAVRTPSGDSYMPNRGLQMMQSQQIVLGYEFMFTPTWKFKTELYGQYLYHAVGDRNGSSWSLLNKGSLDIVTPDSLSNNVRAYNYGLETTIEKFLDKGFYVMITSSFFDSHYYAADKKWRNTRFNGNYIINALGGKEINLTKKANARMKHTLGFGLRITLAGGQRYTPIDLPASIASGKSVYKQDEAFSMQNKTYFRADTKFSYVFSSKRITQTLSFDLQNISNTRNPLLMQYNAATKAVEQINQLGFYPVIQYRIEF